MAVVHDPVPESRLQLLPEIIAQLDDFRIVQQLLRENACRPKTDNFNNIFSPGSPARFVSRPVHQWFEFQTLADVKRSHSFRTVQFVPRHGQQIDSQSIEIHGNLSHCLRGIGVKTNAMFACNDRDLFDRLNCANLVVDVHDGYQHRVWPYCPSYIVRIDQASPINRQAGHIGTQALQKPARLMNGHVLHLTDDQVWG